MPAQIDYTMTRSPYQVPHFAITCHPNHACQITCSGEQEAQSVTMVSVKKIIDGQSQSNEWIGPFNVVFAAYCCGIFVPASFVYYLTFHLLSDRMLATPCSVKLS